MSKIGAKRVQNALGIIKGQKLRRVSWKKNFGPSLSSSTSLHSRYDIIRSFSHKVRKQILYTNSPPPPDNLPAKIHPACRASRLGDVANACCTTTFLRRQRWQKTACLSLCLSARHTLQLYQTSKQFNKLCGGMSRGRPVTLIFSICSSFSLQPLLPHCRWCDEKSTMHNRQLLPLF